MDLKTLLGSAYKENMTLAEIETALADRDMIDRTEAETMATNRAAATKRLLDAANKKLAEEQQKNTATGTENANLLERIAALEEDKKTQTRLSNIATHKASLIAQGYTEELAAATAEALVDGNTAVVLANQGKFLEAKTEAIKEELMKNTKPPVGGGSGSGSTRDFEKEIKDATDNHDFALARALMREKAAAEKGN